MDNAQLFEKMLVAMTGSDTPVACHPSELQPGDTIRHGDKDVQVLSVRQHVRGGWVKWVVFYHHDATGANWDYYEDGPTVSRYLPG